jgi:hypothetical protein
MGSFVTRKWVPLTSAAPRWRSPGAAQDRAYRIGGRNVGDAAVAAWHLEAEGAIEDLEA